MPAATARGRGCALPLASSRLGCTCVRAATIGWVTGAASATVGETMQAPSTSAPRPVMHVVTDPAILYFGTPVVLISTLNEDGSANLAPMSSCWWLRQTAMLGLDPTSQTTINLLRTGQCVLNLPSAGQAAHVNCLALTTGTPAVPPHKQA